MKAVVILSGGQDSSTCALWAKEFFEGVGGVCCVSFDYGQRHRLELEAAKQVSEILGLPHTILSCSFVSVDSSPLTNPEAELETYSDYDSMDKIIGSRVEKTYVPHRNLTFLVHAASYAHSVGANALVVGVCEADNANYPDCRAEFVESAQRTLQLSLGDPSFRIEAPLLALSKSQSIAMALKYSQGEEVLSFSHTCYAGEYPPCGKCHSCVLRAEGFRQAGIQDPLIVRASGGK